MEAKENVVAVESISCKPENSGFIISAVQSGIIPEVINAANEKTDTDINAGHSDEPHFVIASVGTLENIADLQKDQLDCVEIKNNTKDDKQDVNTEDEALLDELHSGALNTSNEYDDDDDDEDDVFPVQESVDDVEEEEEKSQNNIVINDTSFEEDDDDEDYMDEDEDDDDEHENDKKEHVIKPQSVNYDSDNPIEIKDDDDDDDDDDFDEESISSSDNSIGSVEAIKDDDEDKNEADDENDPQVVNVPAPIYGKFRLSIRTKLKRKSIKFLNKRMHVAEDVEKIDSGTKKSNIRQPPTLDLISTTPVKTKENVPISKVQKDHENEDVEMLDASDVVQIDDSPVKLNGNEATSDHKTNQTEGRTNILNLSAAEKVDVSIEIVTNDKESKNTAEEKSDEINGQNVVEENVKDLRTNNNLKEKEDTSEKVVLDEPKPDIPAVPKTNIANNVGNLEVQEERTNRKRCLSASPDDTPPNKRLCAELEENFSARDKLLRGYMNQTPNNSLDDIQRHVDQLQSDIKSLTDLSYAKELEWNNILHLKKIKEEVMLRLIRKRDVMKIMSTKVGEVADYSISDQSQPSLSKKITKEIQNTVMLNSSSVSNVTMVPLFASTPSSGNSTAQAIIESRANMKNDDLAKEKSNTSRLHSILFSRNILPKTAHTSQSSPILNNYMTSTASAHNNSLETLQQQAHIQHMQQLQTNSAINELLNGHHQMPIGRQGATKDVKSIIDDYRQKHPELVPRRGRRLKGTFNNDGTVSSSRSGDIARQSVESRMSELGLLLTKIEGNSRPSSTDSSHSNSNVPTSNMTAGSSVSFKNVLAQFAKMTQNERVNATNILTSTSNTINQTSVPMIKQPPPPGYPEVTLHPVQSHLDQQVNQSTNSHTNSLLHGILTKNTRPTTGFTSYSPTLARLLTAPERITPIVNNYHLQAQQQQTAGINLTKPQSEITITPVVPTSQSIQQTILQQQLQRQHDSRIKSEYFMNIVDDEADDSADRLVIDEGEAVNDQIMPSAGVGQEFQENEVPECQGCKKREAQFVCAGCGNQWYCSRECQVSAWDEHSDVCTG